MKWDRWFTRQERAALLFAGATALLGLAVQTIRTAFADSIREASFVRPAPLSVNRASAAELASLSGIGPVVAQRIVDYRSSGGSYLVAEDLLRVKGVSKKTLEKIRRQIRFD
jgi:competence protein ComEA